MATGLSVFISHAMKDAAVTRQLVDALRVSSGGVAPDFEAFVELDDVTPSASYVAQMSDAIERASAAVIVLTPAFLASAYMSRELSQLFRRRERDSSFIIVPVLLETTEPPGFLKGQPYIDARHRPLTEVAKAVQAALEGSFSGAQRFQPMGSTEYRDRLEAVRKAGEREAVTSSEAGKLTRF